MSEHALPIAVCLLSGGMDSAVTLAQAQRDGFDARALTFRYGQRHAVELEAARRVATALRVREHRVVEIDLSALGGSSLTGAGEVPKDRDLDGKDPRVPASYVPARNTVFLAVALGWAEVLGARDLYLGVNQVDYSGYPDCRPAFLESFEQLAALATAAGTERGARFKVHAPLLYSNKRDIVLRAEALGVDLGWTHTCYDPLVDGDRVLACGHCDACLLRLRGFAEAGRRDPIAYAGVQGKSSARAFVAPRPTGDARVDALRSLLAIVDRLRASDGCPWDLKQTLTSVAPHLIEESHELLEAIESTGAESDLNVVEEAGDLLMGIFLLARIAEDERRFDLARVANAVCDKLIRRHPHVFGEAHAADEQAALSNWEAIKRTERSEKAIDASALAGAPAAMPALQRAKRLGEKSMSAGFRWDGACGALDKLKEELAELESAFERAQAAGAGEAERLHLEHELGDVLLATAFLGNYVSIDPERAARIALRRFEARFRSMEQELARPLDECSLPEMMAAWGRAKERVG